MLPPLKLIVVIIIGMTGLMLLMIYAITSGNKLIASEVDRGTMSFTLNTPAQIVFTKALFYVISIILMAVLMFLFGIVVSLSLI